MIWILRIEVIALAAVALNAQTDNSKFSCQDRTSGYYADVSTGCQVYHMCDGLGRQFSYTCPNATLFQQRMLICDHWYMVNCSKSESDYGANLRIGQREKPFVDDSDSNPYHRTPRPDLLSHPSDTELNIIYRTGRARNNMNLVGVESGSENSTTDEPSYFLPSHWSTEYSQQSTTEKPREKAINFNSKKNLDSNTKTKGKQTKTGNEVVPVNFKSYFKNTTPVYPTRVELTSIAPDSLGILPPLPYRNQIKEPVPEKELSPVNFESKFKATTPVYPQSVEATSQEPGDLGVLPPLLPEDQKVVSNNGASPLSLEVEPPKIGDSPTRNRDVISDTSAPSKFYQPPKFEPDYRELEKKNEEIRGGLKALNSGEWENLRKKFLIPDYDFPLESVSRPSYDSVLSSFQTGPVPNTRKK